MPNSKYKLLCKRRWIHAMWFCFAIVPHNLNVGENWRRGGKRNICELSAVGWGLWVACWVQGLIVLTFDETKQEYNWKKKYQFLYKNGRRMGVKLMKLENKPINMEVAEENNYNKNYDSLLDLTLMVCNFKRYHDF